MFHVFYKWNSPAKNKHKENLQNLKITRLHIDWPRLYCVPFLICIKHYYSNVMIFMRLQIFYVCKMQIIVSNTKHRVTSFFFLSSFLYFVWYTLLSTYSFQEKIYCILWWCSNKHPWHPTYMKTPLLHLSVEQVTQYLIHWHFGSG